MKWASAWRTNEQRRRESISGRARLRGVSLLLLLVGGTAHAVVRNVPMEYPTIQAALDSCVSGDRVVVAPGVYSGPGNIDLDFRGVDVTCASSGGPGVTTIHAGAPGRHGGFALRGGESRAALIMGFTIVGGEAVRGGGISCLGASPTIRNCFVRDCGASEGGGIYLQNSHALVQNVTVSNCRATAEAGTSGHGGSAVTVLDSDASFEDCAFSGNLAFGFPAEPAAVWVRNGASFTRCVISGNAGIGVRADQVDLDHCVLAFNQDAEIWAEGEASVTGSIVRDKCDDIDFVASVGSHTLVTCTMIDPAKVTGSGAVEYLTPPVLGNPNFCDHPNCPSIPSVEGNFAVFPDSPARPENNSCGDFLGAIHAGSCDPAASEGGPTVTPPLALSVSPNPTQGEVSIGLRSEVSGHVWVRLFDPGGRQVWASPLPGLAVGLRRWEGNLRELSPVPLAAGAYTLEVGADGRRGRSPLVLLPR
ncbi:MAG: right-handed parallel beta-helix repeat-containing protein [Candidatus Eisenbacteria bacterium]|nr:right-handed parallel beta-helix repeat-containing protein [Candidatus Eisenbacteria bacterium]